MGRTLFRNFRVHRVRQNSHLKQAKLGTLEYSGVKQAITVWIMKNNTIRLPRRRKKNDKIRVLSIHLTNDLIFSMNNYQNLSEKTEKYLSTVLVLRHLVLEQVTGLFCLHHLGQTWFSCSLYSFHSEQAEQKSSALEHLCWRTPEYSIFQGGADRTVTWPVPK